MLVTLGAYSFSREKKGQVVNSARMGNFLASDWSRAIT